MTSEEIEDRIRSLSTRWCEPRLVADLVGLDLGQDERLRSAFRAWSMRFRGEAAERQTSSGPQIDRYSLETFLLEKGLVSWKQAAVHLGLEADTLQLVVERMEGHGMYTSLLSPVSDQVIHQREAALLFRQFPTLRTKLFSSHHAMCRGLHEAIEKELNLKVEPVLCVTSQILDREDPDFADGFDAITLEPIGLRYQVWLDTKKPVNLRPDACSLKLYAKHQAELSQHVMRGSEPGEIDPKLVAA